MAINETSRRRWGSLELWHFIKRSLHLLLLHDAVLGFCKDAVEVLASQCLQFHTNRQPALQYHQNKSSQFLKIQNKEIRTQKRDGCKEMRVHVPSGKLAPSSRGSFVHIDCACTCARDSTSVHKRQDHEMPQFINMQHCHVHATGRLH